MSSENGWIPWNDRTDLENVFLFVTTELEGAVSDEYLETVGILGISEGVPCYNKTSVIFHLGKIPDKYLLDNIGEIAWGEFSLDCRSQVRLEVLKESDISKVQKRVAENYRSYCKKNGFNNDWCYKKILEIVRDYENSDRESFYREKNNLSDKSAPAPFVSDSPAVPAVPVASVPAVPVDITSIRPYPQILAKSGDNVEQTPNNSEVAMANIGLVSSILTVIQDGFDKVVERLDKSSEIQTQTANNTASINIKTVGRITRIEDIPPLDLGNPNWITAKEYAKIKGLSVGALRSNRSSGDKSDDGKAGIHNGHAWRAIGKGSKAKVYYYLY